MLRIVVSRGNEELGASDHQSDLVRIGSQEDNDVQIEDPALSGHHAEIWSFNGACQIRSPDGVPLQLGDQTITGRGQVQDGAALRVGDLSFVVLIDPPPEADTLERLKRTRRTGRVRLKGSELLELPENQADQLVLLRARRVLVHRGATDEELTALRNGGVERAQKILDEAAAAGQLPSDRPTTRRQPVAEAPATQRIEPQIDKRRLALVAMLSVTGLGGLAGAIYLVRELLLSFTT